MINYIEKGIGLFEFLTSQGYTLYQLDGVWTAEPPGSDDIVNALIAAYQPPATPRKLSKNDFFMRLPVELFGRICSIRDSHPRLEIVYQLFIQEEINLDHEILSRELDYLMTLKDGKGFLLLQSEKDAILA